MAAVRDIDRGWKRILTELETVKGKEVVVGILEGSEQDGESIAEYAAHNEYGTEHIPERPFMSMAFDENLPKIKRDFRKEVGKVISGASTANTMLTVIGMKHAQRVQQTITGRDILPRLAPATVKAKKGSEKTLVDTGEMVNAVQIEIRGSKK